MTTEEVQAKLTDFEARIQRAIAFRDQAREQANQAEIGVHQLQGAVAVLRELLQSATPDVAPPPTVVPAGANGAALGDGAPLDG